MHAAARATPPSVAPAAVWGFWHRGAAATGAGNARRATRQAIRIVRNRFMPHSVQGGRAHRQATLCVAMAFPPQYAPFEPRRSRLRSSHASARISGQATVRRLWCAGAAGTPVMSVQEALEAAQKSAVTIGWSRRRYMPVAAGKVRRVRRRGYPRVAGKASAELLGSPPGDGADWQRRPAGACPAGIEQATVREQEFYLAWLIDRSRQRVVFMASRAGGMDIEQGRRRIARADSCAWRSIQWSGCSPYQCRRIGLRSRLGGRATSPAQQAHAGAVSPVRRQGPSAWWKINPLVLTQTTGLLAAGRQDQRRR